MPAGLARDNSQGAETRNILSTNQVFNKHLCNPWIDNRNYGGRWEAEGDNVITWSCAKPAMSSSRDNHILLSVLALVGHRRGLPTCRQRAFPQLLTGFYIKRAQILIHRGGDEDESTRCDD